MLDRHKENKVVFKFTTNFFLIVLSAPGESLKVNQAFKKKCI